MLNALRTIHTIRPATTDMAARLGFTVFLRGSLHQQLDALQELRRRQDAGLTGGRPRFFRSRGRMQWSPLPEKLAGAGLRELAGIAASSPGAWTLEFAELKEADAEGTGAWWQFADLPPVCGLERASYIRALLPADTGAATLAALGEWSMDQLRLWWGAGGYVFHHTFGSPTFASQRMAALAKRYWAVQIQDMAALQWDALRGMPGVNWLTLLGDAFAHAAGLQLDEIASAAAGQMDRGVFHRRGDHGIALAAGPHPLSGDINVGEDLGPYVRIAKLVEPLLLKGHTPLPGPFGRPEVLNAWLGRFSNPQAWLACRIAPE